MSHDDQNLEQIIEADRSMLERALGQLTQAISPEQISNRVAREVQTRGGTLGTSVMDAARANPAGAVLVGVGIAALLAGPKRPHAAPSHDVRDTATAQGFSGRDPLTSKFDRRVEAADAAEDAEPRAPKLRAALNAGLASLPEPARERVLETRRAALDVQEKLDAKAAAAARRARSFHQRQPLSTGAVALGLGAVLAAVLPRTRVEDDMLGARRDALLEQAELALRDEIAAATETGEAALRDGVEAGYDRLRQH